MTCSFLKLLIFFLLTLVWVFVFPVPRPFAWPPALAPICIYRSWLSICIYRPCSSICVYRPWLQICIYRLWPTILLQVRGLSFAYTDLVSSICICIYDPCLRFVLPVRGLNLHLPYYW